jgi:hypothetical protein
VSLAEPSLFTPERVAYIVGLAGMKPGSINASILTFGRHFASSWVTGAMLTLFASHQRRLHLAANSEWEYREGVLSLTSVVSYVTSSSSSATDESLSPQQAAEVYVALLRLVIKWRLSTDRTADDTWKLFEGEDELMDAVGHALRDLVGDREDTRKHVEIVFTSSLGDFFYDVERKRLLAIVERSLSAQQDDPLLTFFRSPLSIRPRLPLAQRRYLARWDKREDGIVHKTTPLLTRELNGVAERFN